ncbi:MAG: DNA/RNA non-specific endonuclease [Acidobacteria bacterium]|nr:DNA/RNA non-specific endonuclease [Acidobacteriota bacterium]MBI3279773.1 DNA/RNA non-specific endonuclease [Acidobacteriota bacterium]
MSSTAAVTREVEFAYDRQIGREALARWRKTTEERTQRIRDAREKGLVAADTPERVVKRANRLLNKVKQAAPQRPPRSKELDELLNYGPTRESLEQPQFLERIIGETKDFLRIEFLERAVVACRSVCRLMTRVSPGRVKLGTGFMVSPRLLMTNHHVLRNGEEAALTLAEFDYQIRAGAQLPIHRFTLEPKAFFLNDKDLDFALVAIKPTSQEGVSLNDYGYSCLNGDEGKILISENINIVQHPLGEVKQVVIRENRLLNLLPKFAHYEADTEPGSSGSPVFNDEWDVVALHHSGVPKTDNGNLLDKNGNVWRDGDDPALLAWQANEGIRVSVLVKFIESAALRNRDEEVLRKQFLSAREAPPPVREARVSTVKPRRAEKTREDDDDDEAEPRMRRESTAHTPGAVSVSLPLQITVSLGGVGVQAAAAAPALAHITTGAAPELEAIEPDQDYDNRPGYDPEFLGFTVPLPALTDAVRDQAIADGSEPLELKYYHYSVIMNAGRKLAFVSAVNFDAAAPVRHKREGGDRWFLDPRIDEELQAGEELYSKNPLDRGHLARRADAAWGATRKEAKLANDDTFHFTNCSPQHEIFNQSRLASKQGLKLWGNIEDHIAGQAKANNRRVNVFNGPIFRANDRKYRDVKLPREYWKLLVFENDADEPRALAFVLSQSSLIKNLPLEEMDFEPYRPFQIKVRKLEERTKLDFGELPTFDPLEEGANEAFLEAATGALEILSLDQIVL